MRAITHGLGTALLLVATAVCTLVQLAHVDRAFQQIGGRDGGTGQVSLVSHTDSNGSGSGSRPHGHHRR